jgi:hypothetical protein
MNHRYFEEQVLSYQDPKAEPLDPEQVQEIRSHLAGCQSCQRLQAAWSEAEHTLQNSPLLSPDEGFSGRFMMKLNADRQRLQHRQTLLVFAFCLGAIVLLTGSLILLAWPWFKSPGLVTWFWISRIFSLLTLADGIRDGAGIFVQTISQVMPLSGWIFIIGMMSEFAVIWLVIFRLLTNPRRVTQ